MLGINDETISLIRRWEGLRLFPYRCPAGIPTIGYGSTVYPNGKRVSIGDPKITEAQAVNMLAGECVELLKKLKLCVKVKMTDNMAGALVSLCYNIGMGAFHKSTLLRRLNAKMPKQMVADEFLKWDKARLNGVLTALPGLTERRKAERALFLKG